MPVTEPMTPDHPRWNEFIERLSRTLICRKSTANARHVLGQFGAIEVERSLETLARMGGTCDCAIVFGVAGVADPSAAAM